MIEIKKLSSPLPYEDLAEVLRDAFKERTEAGLNFLCASFNGDDLKNHLSNNAVVFGAYHDNAIIGMNVLNSIREKYGIRFGTSEYGAIRSNYKRQGIGYALFKKRIQEAKQLGLDFILSDTAVSADSAVQYHKKVGFKIYGYSQYPNRTYLSVNFILPLTFMGYLLASWIGRKILGLLFTNTKQ